MKNTTNKNYNKKAKIADWIFGGTVMTVTLLVVPLVFGFMALWDGFSSVAQTGFFAGAEAFGQRFLFGVIFAGTWSTIGFLALARTERFSRYARIFGMYPRVKISQIEKEMNKPLKSVSADLNAMKSLGYFPNMSFDLVHKEVVFSENTQPLPQIGDEALTVFEEKRGFPFFSIIAAGVTAGAFSPARTDIPALILAVLFGIGAFFLVLKFFPAPVSFVRVARQSSRANSKKPTATGNADLDSTLTAIYENKSELVRLSQSIASSKIRTPLKEILRVLDEIAGQIKESPDKVKCLRQFVNYYLPTTVSFLQTYEELETKPDKGENINAALKKIEDVAASMIDVFKREYDDLFSDIEMDVSAEVAVMQALIKESKDIL